MRPRKWVLIVASIVLTLGIALFLGKRSLERNRNLENLLVKAVAPVIKGTCTVDAVRIGFFSVNLHNVAVAMPLQSVGIRIRTIKAGLSFSRLLIYRGDISRAINQIIIIKPVIDLSIEPSDRAPPRKSATAAAPSPSPPAAFAEVPVRFLHVKDGTVRLINRTGDTAEIAGHLSGKLSGTPDELSLTLTGKAGSHKKNLSLQGTLSWLKNRHYFSLRLADARLGKPFSAGAATINSGNLNGAVECTFSNNFDPDSMELHGWMRLSEGNTSIGSPQQTVSSLLMNISLENRECRLDSLAGSFRGMQFTGTGSYRFGSTPSGGITLSCQPCIPDSLADFLPPEIAGNLSGSGSINGTLLWSAGNDPRLNLSAQKFTYGTTPLRRIDAALRLSGTTLLADSMLIATSLFSGRFQGFYNFDTARTSYDLGFSLTADSLPDSPGIEGTLRAIGTVTPDAAGPVVNCRISARNLRYEHIYFGNPQVVMQIQDNHCTFKTVDIDSTTSVVVSGSIDSVFTPSPRGHFTLSVGSRPIKDQLMRMHGMPELDSANLMVNSTGWLNRFHAAAKLDCKARDFNGTLIAQINRSPEDTGALVWNLHLEDGYYKSVPVQFDGRGRIMDSCVLIDTLSACNGIRGTAKIFHTAQPPFIQASMDYTMKIADLLQFFPAVSNGTIKGIVSGKTVLYGPFDSLRTTSKIALRNLGANGLEGFTTALSVTTSGTGFTILPTVLLRDSQKILTVDTIHNPGGHLHFRATFSDLTPQKIAGSLLPGDLTVNSLLSGTVATTDTGFPLQFSCKAPFFLIDSVKLDSIACSGTITTSGLSVSRLEFRDGNRTAGKARGSVPWAILGKNASDLDTLHGEVHLNGDLLATIDKNITSPIGGSGRGTADLAFFSSGGNWTFTKGSVVLPKGVLEVRPFVPDQVKNFTFQMLIDSNAVVNTDMSGTIKRKPIRIFSEHKLPDGYEPVMIGPLNLGAFQVATPKKGVDLHLPGFMALKERGGIEFRGKKPFDYFTISGPLEKLKLTGTWVLRDIEFTFPFLPFKELQWESDPFPYITWEMDVITGNRKAMYYWDLAGKRGRILRFLEGYLDPSSGIRVRGRDLDKTFRVYGTIRSYKGAVYYGRVFDRNFDVGVEFNPQKPKKNLGYDNLPLLWGSAEAFADTSRLDRIKLTCMVVDPVTGAVSEKARLADQPTPNISFHLSSDFDELPGESEREYYRKAGITFTTIGGAGSVVSNFGEQLFHRYLLQRWERKLARKLGLDVMNIESSIVSNYFSKLYDRQFNGLLNEDDYLALANVGVTVGRYFFRDFLLLKARGELIPIDMALTPEYSIGFEFQPSRYLTMDLNYGFHMSEAAIEHSPLLMMQLRLPITRLRNLLHF